jgi:hypothetical protein
MAISAWIDTVTGESPDGRYVAIYDRSVEIAMGGPTVGRLVIRLRDTKAQIAVFTDAGPSFVWAEDSSAIAFPRWTYDRMQRLAVLPLPGSKAKTLETLYSVLELHRFADGVVTGIDSPISHPREIRVRVLG